MCQQCRPERDENGQTTSEYAVALGVITVGIVVLMTTLSGQISALVNRVSGFFPG